MKTLFSINENAARRARQALGVTAALALLSGGVRTFADSPVTMAPPLDSGVSQTWNGPTSLGNGADAGQDTVFNWQEVPQDQQVPVRRAIFDQGGYQLYDTAGETIVVPFTDHNLYVMKFAVSPNGSTYFVNTGDTPVLYIPRGSSLENAAVPGARWYPFSEDFHPAQPVFLGIAPSWDDYCTMGWYPDMAFYGGYWGRRPFLAGSLSLFTPTFGLSIVLGGRHYNGWEPYHRYYHEHPAPYHITIVNRSVYRFGGRPGFNHGGVFRGGGRSYSAGRGFGEDHHDFGGGRVFNGTGHPVYAHRDIPGDRRFENNRSPGSVDGHVFNNNGRTFHGTGPSSGGRAFGGRPNADGGRPFGSDRPTFGGNTRSTSGETARPAFQGGHSFGGGGQPSGGNRSFSENRTFSGGGRNSGSEARPALHGGDRGNAGGRPSSGGARPSSGDRGDHGGRR